MREQEVDRGANETTASIPKDSDKENGLPPDDFAVGPDRGCVSAAESMEWKAWGAAAGGLLVEGWDVKPWPEAVSGAELLDELAREIQRPVVLPKWALEAVVLWVVHTYAFRLRDVTTYLGIESPEHRCGKSTLLDTLGLLVQRPVRTANISPSAFFRVIADTQPTLLIDEADMFLHSEELKGILNSGYQRKGAFVVRMTPYAGSAECGVRNGERGSGNGANGASGHEMKGQSLQLANFSTWCPKAIARIGRLPHVLADRCIVFRMQRKLPTEACERLDEKGAERLRSRCLRFVLDRAEAIGKAQPALPAGMNDRAADIWGPLLVIADLAGGAWPERARQAATGLSSSAQEGDPMGTLLLDLLELFIRMGQERVFSRTMVAWLERRADRPWMELRKGKKVSELWLAHQLRPYGIRAKTMRIGEERAKGYVMEDFGEVFRRYIPKGEYAAFRAELVEEAEGSKPGVQDPKTAGTDEANLSG